MSDKFQKIIAFENELLNEQEAMPGVLEQIISDYRTKAHHQIARMMRENDENHEHNLSNAKMKAREKELEINEDRDAVLESVTEKYKQKKEEAVTIILKEVMKHGNR